MKAQSTLKDFFTKNGGNKIRNIINTIKLEVSSKKRTLAEVNAEEGHDKKDESIQAVTSKSKKPSKSKEKEQEEPKAEINKSQEKKPKTKKSKKETELEEEKVHIEVEIETKTTKSTVSTFVPSKLEGDPLESYERFIADLGDWQDPLNDYLKRPAFQQVYKFVKTEYETQTVFPPKQLIFNAFKHVSFHNLKVVVVGQDPYIKDGEAMGLSFSVPKHIKVPPSLKNIYKALENDPKIDFKMPQPLHGDLTNWADQGVLLLNAILTVRKGASNSHQKKGWEQFTDHVIQVINKKADGVVFMLWGTKAIEKVGSVDSSKHLLLKGVHPSPLAGTSFPKCTHFSEANEYLKLKGKNPIDWNIK